jgi:hypothetical protein
MPCQAMNHGVYYVTKIPFWLGGGFFGPTNVP